MTVADLARPTFRAVPLPVILVAIPAIFSIFGLIVRFAAYKATIDDATIANFFDGLCRWDCEWYVRMAETGYDPFPVPRMIAAGNWAFFPLYPMTIGLLRLVTSLPTMTVATITSVVLTNFAVISAWPLFEKNLRAYALYAAFLLAGPFSVYFTTFYTEVMFVLLMTLVFVALKRSQYLAAGGLALLLSSTRIVGVFIVLAIGVQALTDHLRGGGTLKSFVPWALKRPDLVLAIFIAPLGLFGYMAFLHYQVGDALAFQHVQVAWARQPGNPLGYLWSAMSRGPQSGFLPSVSQQLGMAAIAGFALIGVLIWRRQYAAAVFCFACIMLPMGAGMASMLRFVVAQAPLMIVLMTLLSRWRWLAGLSLIGFCVANYFCTVGWLTGYLTIV